MVQFNSSPIFLLILILGQINFEMAKRKNSKFDYSEWSLQFINEPFKLFKLSNVFADPKHVEKLKKEVDCLSFSHKVTDIFSLSQTKDLFRLSAKSKIISNFLQFLHFFRKFLSKKFGVNLDSKISVSCSKYSFGDFLLCHDDKTEDRLIAFIYYLNSSWDQTWGGSLDIFDHDENGQPSDVRYSFYPEGNTMIFFEVGNHTHHQVSEVLTPHNNRITINGWFHSKKALEMEPLPLFTPVSCVVETSSRGSASYLQNLVNDEFVEEKYKELIVESIERKGVIMMQNFLKCNSFDAISNELNSSSISWIQQGPANRKKYEIADLKKLPPKTRHLITYFQSNFMCSYFESISGLKFYRKITGCEYIHLMMIEIQSWQRGCYSIMTNDDSNLKNVTLDVLLFFNVVDNLTGSVEENASNVAGNIYYCQKESVAVKHEIEPSNNSICLVHKQKDETSFVPYISLNSNLKFHVIRLSFKL